MKLTKPGDERKGSNNRSQLDVCLGMREAEDDWLELRGSLTRRGLRAPLPVVERVTAASATEVGPQLLLCRRQQFRIFHGADYRVVAPVTSGPLPA